MFVSRISNADKIQKVFKVFDKNDDGWVKYKLIKLLFLYFSFISTMELAKVMSDLGERLSEEEVRDRSFSNTKVLFQGCI